MIACTREDVGIEGLCLGVPVLSRKLSSIIPTLLSRIQPCAGARWWDSGAVGVSITCWGAAAGRSVLGNPSFLPSRPGWEGRAGG